MKARVQPTVRSFFQPQAPSYTAPPTAPVSQSDAHVPPKPDSRLPPYLSVLPAKNLNNTTLPSLASISTIHEKHIQPLRRINSLLLPINYPDNFYHKILDDNTPANFSRVILWDDASSIEPKVIGGIVRRLDPVPTPESTSTTPIPAPGTFDIYIQSLALLSPHRSKGLATSVLDAVIISATTQCAITVRELYAHVWTENTEALQWYAARGFKREEVAIPSYYRRLKPDTAWILRRRLGPSDHLAHSSPSQPAIQTQAASISGQNAESETPPPPVATALARPKNPPSARSFQDRGPDREWNDLPEDVVANTLLKPHSTAGSEASSRSSSRSGLEGKGKKKRQYPAAAFGS